MADNVVDGVIASAARRSSRRAGRPAEKRPLERGRELLGGFTSSPYTPNARA
jgi:hypothetical protein